MSLTKQKFDGLYVSHLLNCECYILTSVGIFIQDILIRGEHELQVYTFKVDHVPVNLAQFGVTDPTLAHGVNGWFRYALKKGFVTHLEDMFPQSSISSDFVRDSRREELLSNVAELQTQVAALDATFSTDSERVLAIQGLQNQITSNDDDIAAEILARDVAIDVEKQRALLAEGVIVSYVNDEDQATTADIVLVRQEQVDGDSAIRGSVSGTHDTLGKLEIAINNEGGTRLTADQAATTDRQTVRDEFAAEDSAMKLRLVACEEKSSYIDPISQNQVTTQITAAKDELLGAPSDALNTLQELGAALNNDADYAVTITNALSAKAPKSSPVFLGTHAIFQSGIQVPSGQTYQGQQFVGNDSITIRSIVDGNVILSAHGSGVVTSDSDLQITGVCKQNGYPCLDTNSSIVSEVAGKQTQLGADELLVVAGDAFNSSNYTLSATIASERATAVLVETTRALLAEGVIVDYVNAEVLETSTDIAQEITDRQTAIGQEVIDRNDAILVEKLRAEVAEAGLQIQLETDELAVIAGSPFNSSTYTLSATIASERAAAVLVETTRALAAEGGLQTQLETGELLVVAGDAFNSSNYTQSATITSERAAAVLVETTRALAAEGGLQIQLETDELAVIGGEVYSTAEKQKVADADTVLGDRSAEQLGFLDATSAIQAQFTGKEPTLSTARAAVCDGEVYSTVEKQKVSDADTVLGDRTAEQLGYLNATSAIQAQIDSKHASLNTSSIYHDSVNHRLGLGLTAPTSKLHVHDTSGLADIKISRDLNDNHLTLNSASITKYGNGSGSGALRIRVVSTDPMTFETSNTEAVKIHADGTLESKFGRIKNRQNATIAGTAGSKQSVLASAQIFHYKGGAAGHYKLPPPVDGKELCIINRTTHTLNLYANDSEDVNGAGTTAVLTLNIVHAYSDGDDWFVG